MSNDVPPPEDSEAAERRASELLLVLRDQAPTPAEGLTHRILRRARVQQTIATPLRMFGAFAAALVDGVRAAAAEAGRKRS